MTEPPRPPGEGAGASPPDPTSSPPGSYPPPGGAPPPPGYSPPPPPPQYGAPPPSGGYPPAGGTYTGGSYPQSGFGPAGAPAGYANNDEKTWALIAHFGGALGVIVGGGVLGWVAPLIAMMTKGAQSPTVRAHSVGALNFQITWALAGVASWILAGITCGLLIFIPLLIWIVPVVFGIIGGVKANDGQLYRYPMSINMIK